MASSARRPSSGRLMLSAMPTPSKPTLSATTGSTRSEAEKWIGTTTHLKPKTRESYESILRNHLIPEFGDRAIGSIDHPEVLSFLSRLASDGRSAGTVSNILDVMRSVFKLAVRAGVVKNNPVLDIKAPRAVKQEMIFLTEDQVLALADEIQNPPPLQRGASHREGGYPDYALLVRFADRAAAPAASAEWRPDRGHLVRIGPRGAGDG